MNTLNKHSHLLLGIYFISLLASVVLLTCVYLTKGLSATSLLLLIISALFLVSIFSLFNRQDKQVIQVIKALANGDNTLGFSSHHPMREYFDEVQQQMQTARFNSEQQSEFFKTLLVHINLAVIVCDAKGKVIESNPAVARLLGKSVKDLNDLSHIGTMILMTDKPLHSTVQWQYGEQQDTLTLQVSIAEIQGQERKIVTLQSIHELLLNKEQQAYKRLTQVLTHEVANTITPLASLAQTCQGLLPQMLSFNDEEHKQDLQLGLTTLATRTECLGDFIASFRQISSLPLPMLVPTQVTDIVERIGVLHQQQLAENNITFDIKIKSQQLVMLDSSQVEQVLINLIKNAIESVTLGHGQQSDRAEKNLEQGIISLTVGQNSAQQLYIEIADNGAGIAGHVIEMIFVPFFTTKQQGSGIGLSLSRQIMVNHGGDLVYLNRPKGACFRCIFG
ncbi:sensor histidine kinase [Cognaticolwellia beringensis]|uniref:histidine kinase n=1 Tax=Cognaticolwellia beringensis TaxID=1967665 RepID=A0A222G5H1_9GAMM|nr:ATP-binding protein [Cognaticolwellia beringensis]ASP47051.1 histidine kinase [Cognaticolwellia beringensis]